MNARQTLRPPRTWLEISEAEEELGFEVTPVRHGVIAIAAELRVGLLAVKGRGPDGGVEYRICDRELDQLYATASSLNELRWRFDLSARTGKRVRCS